MKIPLYEFLCCLLRHHLGFLGRLRDHGPDFFQANRQIPHLVATLLWGHNQLTSPVYLILVLKGWENVMWPLKPRWNCHVLTEPWKPWLEGEGWYHQSHVLSHSFGNPVGWCQVEPNLCLGIDWEEKEGLCFHVTARLQIYEIIQPGFQHGMIQWISWKVTMLFPPTVFWHTTLQDKLVPVVVFAFLDTTEFIASHCLPHF